MKKRKAKNKHLQKRSLAWLAFFAILTIGFGLAGVKGLVQNSQGAKDRYDSLIAVDKAGGDVSKSLNELRAFIFNHMNTQIGNEEGINPPIQLKGTYDRLLAAEEARVIKINKDLTPIAQQYCEDSNPNDKSSSSRLNCIQEYVNSHGGLTETINSDLYKFDFAPPVWSTDLAGLGLLLSAISGLVFIIDLMFYFRTKRMVHLAN